MRHPECDQDLLLLAHGHLSPLRRWRTQWHLRRCPDCRQRLDRLQAVSQALAGVIRTPQRRGLPLGAIAPAAFPSIAALAWVVVTTLLLLILLGALAVRNSLHTPPPIPAGGCRPDLPNDRCR